MTEKKIAYCGKCQQDINKITGINRWPGLGAKTEKGAWCFGCFKSISHCKVCGNSVAQMEVEKHKPDLRASWTLKPINGFGQHCKFICSQKCLESDRNRKKQKRQARLEQGWKECEGCIEKYGWIYKEKLFKRERIFKLVPPGEKLCGNLDYPQKRRCKWDEKVGKPARQRAQIKAQNYWDSLSQEQRLAEIARLDGVFTAKWFGKNYTVEEIATWKKVTPDIIEEFVRHELGESWERIKATNNSQTATNTNSQISSSFETINDQISKKEVELQKLKDQGENSAEIVKLEREIQELLEKQSRDNNSSPEKSPKNNGLTPWIVGGISMVALVGIIIVIAKAQRKRNKIK